MIPFMPHFVHHSSILISTTNIVPLILSHSLTFKLQFMASSFSSSCTMALELERPRITEIHVRMDCNGCIQKIKKALTRIKGIYDLYIDFPQQKVKVIRRADPEIIMKAIKKVRKAVTICSNMEVPDPNHHPTEPTSGGGAPPPEGGAQPREGAGWGQESGSFQPAALETFTEQAPHLYQPENHTDQGPQPQWKPQPEAGDMQPSQASETSNPYSAHDYGGREGYGQSYGGERMNHKYKKGAPDESGYKEGGRSGSEHGCFNNNNNNPEAVYHESAGQINEEGRESYSRYRPRPWMTEYYNAARNGREYNEYGSGSNGNK